LTYNFFSCKIILNLRNNFYKKYSLFIIKYKTMENQEVKSTTVQEEWMGQTSRVDGKDKQEEIVVRECSCLFD